LVRWESRAEKNLFHVASGLSEKGHTCTICCFRLGDHFVKELQGAGVDVISLGATNPVSKEYVVIVKDLMAIVRRKGVEILVSYDFSSDLVGIGCRILNRKMYFVSNRRDMGFMKTKRQRIFLRIVSPLTDGYIVPSKAVGKYICELEGADINKTAVINNFSPQGTVNCREREVVRERHGIKNGEFLVLSVGHLRAEKGHQFLISAFASAVRDHRVEGKLILVGNDLVGLKEKLEETAKKLGIFDRIVFPGYVDPPDGYFQAADLFVLPSSTEGMSNALLEAMGYGLPCIATRVGGNPECITDGIDGYLIEYGDTGDLASKIAKLYIDSNNRERFSTQIKWKAENDFSKSNMIKKTESFLNNILKKDIHSEIAG
jgi:glycosyltransferase involved in cell wall biosynthesis